MKSIVKKRDSSITREPFPFEVVHFGEPANNMHMFHWHDFLELSYVNKGRGTYEVENKQFDVGPGDIVIINDSERHRVRFDPETPLYETVFHFTPAFLRSKAESGRSRRYLSLFSYDKQTFVNKPTLSAAARSEVRILVHRIAKEFQSRDRHWELAVEAHLLALIALLMRAMDSGTLPDTHLQERKANIRRLEEITGYLRKNFAQELTLPSVAARFGLNPTYFSEYFSTNIGMGLREYLTHLRIHEAARLLNEQNLSLTRVALEVGFANPGSFYASFRRIMGTTPRKYRDVREG